MQKHPLIELYVTIDDEQQSTKIEQILNGINLDEVVQRTLRAVGITQQVMLTLLVTDDAGIREMNQQYREQDKPTDVLSFPLLDTPLVQAPSDQLWPPREDAEQQQTPEFVTPPGFITNLGDIIMSWSTIERQAHEEGHSTIHELLYLLSHGVLHLVGYDDHTESGYQAMVNIQQAVLRTLGA